MPLIPFSASDDRRLLEIDRARLWAIMCKPSDPSLVAVFDGKLRAALESERGGDAETTALLRNDLLKFEEVTINDGAAAGVTCGEVLLYALANETSLGAAFRSVQRIQAKKKRRGFSRSHLKQRVWPRYRSVAHLWAAFICSERLYGAPAQELGNLRGFLALAEQIREAGEAFRPKNKPDPILNAEETWKLSPGVVEPWVPGGDWRDPELYRDTED